MTASRDSRPSFPTAKGLIVSMEGVCYSIVQRTRDCPGKNYYCRIALYDFVSGTALEMLADFYA